MVLAIYKLLLTSANNCFHNFVVYVLAYYCYSTHAMYQTTKGNELLLLLLKHLYIQLFLRNSITATPSSFIYLHDYLISKLQHVQMLLLGLS